MVNTRSKFRKTQNTLDTSCVSEDSDSDHELTQSGALIGSNDDLLTEILLRLPVTSILRFKSVSKHWRSLLSHTHFTKRLDFYPDPRGIRIVQSCNGLLLCCSHLGSMGVCKYYVFNPTTKQFAIIPSIPGGYKARKTISFMGLAFHQTDCVHYKIVCIRSLEPNGNLFQIQIYSSDTRKWKIAVESFYTDWDFFCRGVYWNGALHWAPFFRNRFYFKIDAEQLHTLPVPAEMTSFETRALYFGESRGHLHLTVGVDYDETSLHLNVYEMLSDHSGWFVKYQVELCELRGAFPEMTRSPYDFNVIDVVRGEKEEDTFIVLIIPGKLIRYNVHDKSFKYMCNVTDYIAGKYAVAHHHTETLASF